MRTVGPKGGGGGEQTTIYKGWKPSPSISVFKSKPERESPRRYMNEWIPLSNVGRRTKRSLKELKITAYVYQQGAPS